MNSRTNDQVVWCTMFVTKGEKPSGQPVLRCGIFRRLPGRRKCLSYRSPLFTNVVTWGKMETYQSQSPTPRNCLPWSRVGLQHQYCLEAPREVCTWSQGWESVLPLCVQCYGETLWGEHRRQTSGSSLLTPQPNRIGTSWKLRRNANAQLPPQASEWNLHCDKVLGDGCVC